MSKFFVVFMFLYFATFSHCFATDNVVISVGFRLNMGEHREEVFAKKRLLSVLYWPVLPAIAFNFGIDFYAPYFHFLSEVNAGFPAIAGDMRDEDYTDERQQKITLFSKHTAHLKEDFSIRSSIGIPIKCFSPAIEEKKQFSLTLEPSIGVYFSHIKWHAREGYLQYRENIASPDFKGGANYDSHFWKPSWPKISYTGDGVTYIKKTIFPFFQFDVKFLFKKKWIILCGAMFSPFLFSYSTDIHFDKKTAYLDNFILPGFAFEVKSHVEWKIVKHCSIFGSLSYSIHHNKNGKTDVISLLDGEHKTTFNRGSAGLVSNVASFLLGSKFYF